MVPAYAIVSVIVLLIMVLARLTSATSRNSLYNWLSITHAGIYLILTFIMLGSSRFPEYFLTNQYFFVDSLGAYEVLISSTIFVLSSLYARGYVDGLLHHGEIDTGEIQLFYIALNSLFVTVVYAFFSNNMALFWILLEITTLLSAILIVTLNAKENIMAALKYLFTASTAMLFSIIGLIILFAITKGANGSGTLNWNLLMEQANGLSPSLLTLAFILIFIGFAAKAGIVPFHTWLPQAHAKAPSVISVLLSAVLLNIGIYGILRMYAVVHQTAAVHSISVLLIAFGILSIGLAAFSMLPRSNIKKLIAFSSIEHMGFILVGIGIGTPLTIFWVMFHTLAHALVKTLLFFSAGILHQQYRGNKFEKMEDALLLQPLASWGFIIGSLAVIGTPLFPIFLSKFFILEQLGSYSLPLLFLVLALFLLVAAAFATILIRTFSQKNGHEEIVRYNASWSMKLSMTLVLAAILTLGVYFPSGLSDIFNNIVAALGFRG
ncbi:MAG: proton-conducting transporter membrane subunit [Dehalococcoidales bacterium]|nr:proton-conducting transporter membrane subunit [Dehalococcoidales bacterium]